MVFLNKIGKERIAICKLWAGLVLSAKFDKNNINSTKDKNCTSERIAGTLQSAKKFAYSFLFNPGNEFWRCGRGFPVTSCFTGEHCLPFSGSLFMLSEPVAVVNT